MGILIYREGSRGPVVAMIQKKIGCFPDGIFGPLTTEALRAWQKAHRLTPDGVAGPKTLAALGLASTQQQTPSAGLPDSVVSSYGGNTITLKRSKRRIDYIAVHCTATPEGQAMTVDDIRRIHKANGWSDIGYHYVIDLKGRVHIGRDVHLSGAHVSGYNPYSIGVVYVGGLENKPGVPYNKLPPKDTRTDAQKAALLALLVDLRKLYPKAKIQGHRDFSKDLNGNGIIEPQEWIKACPSFDAKTEFKNV